MSFNNYLEEIKAELSANAQFYSNSDLQWFGENLEGIETKSLEDRIVTCSELLKGLNTILLRNVVKDDSATTVASNRFLREMIIRMKQHAWN